MAIQRPKLEHQKLSTAQLKSPLEYLTGGYLFVEGLGSILYSQDQRSLSQLGRLGRIAIGSWLCLR